VSSELYKEEKKAILTSNFASFETPDQYAVKNSKKAEVGVIIGNGMVVQLDDPVKYPKKSLNKMLLTR
jgi:hypothetical protein